MCKILLTLLGTNDYLPCNYYFEGSTTGVVTRFVQEALARHLFTDWSENDRMVVFLTKKARERNWLDNGHLDRDGKRLQREGLKRRLESLQLPVKIETQEIKIGRTNEEMWDIFNVFYSKIKEEDIVYLDITHALRFLPMLALIILNYAKSIKKIKIENIFYGSLEALGSIQELLKMKPTARRVPVLEFKGFIQLFDWTNASNNFINFGEVKDLETITKEYITDDLVKSKGEHKEAKAASKSAKMLKAISEDIKTCRTYNLIITENFEEIREQLAQTKTNYFQPLKPLIEKIDEKICDFKKGELKNGFVAVKWCIDHQLTQQGITILQETVISLLVEKFFGKDAIVLLKKRAIVTKALNIKARKIAEEKWQATEEEKEIIKKILEKINENLAKSFNSLSSARNDINHGGFIQPKSAEKLQKELKKHYETLSNFF